MSRAVISPGPVTTSGASTSVASECIRHTMPLRLSTMSVTSSATPLMVENSWATPSIRTDVTAAPASVARGQTFTLGTDSGGISAVMLVAPGATTHANDMHQRAVRLQNSGKGNSLSVSVPAQAGLLPPGYYMLFAINGKGVPSVARFVRVS